VPHACTHESAKLTRLITELQFEVVAQAKLAQLLPRWPDLLAVATGAAAAAVAAEGVAAAAAQAPAVVLAQAQRRAAAAGR
jgi:hypothetical protein